MTKYPSAQFAYHHGLEDFTRNAETIHVHNRLGLRVGCWVINSGLATGPPRSPSDLHLNRRLWVEGRILHNAILQNHQHQTLLKDNVLGEITGIISACDDVWVDNKSDEVSTRPQEQGRRGYSIAMPLALLEI
ncbi:het domain-containing protein [Colletotrichum incanum]|uniref:Het domain-containing protein n=1 Tax=Colletotrichum incanum TaxID=1573173 RepID=A0A161XY56_COLIC|nr:het domain-containing protein [Colletotrichum incanum]